MEPAEQIRESPIDKIQDARLKLLKEIKGISGQRVTATCAKSPVSTDILFEITTSFRVSGENITPENIEDLIEQFEKQTKK